MSDNVHEDQRVLEICSAILDGRKPRLDFQGVITIKRPTYIKERERLMNQMADSIGLAMSPNCFALTWPAIKEQALPNCSADECGGLKYYERTSRVPLWSR